MTSDLLLLRLDAPLMSFGGVAVDSLRVTRRFPARSMLAGLFANALGWEHDDHHRLGNLQERIRLATRCDRAGREITDYQTVDLGQPSLVDTGWTIRGAPQVRGGGSAKTGTHIRHRNYLADAIYTLAVQLVDGDGPSLDDLERALIKPARPLFIGRRACLPATRMLLGRTSGALVAALEAHPRSARTDVGALPAWWPADSMTERPDARLIPVTDDRDWQNQIHVGRRFIYEGTVNPQELGHAR